MVYANNIELAINSANCHGGEGQNTETLINLFNGRLYSNEEMKELHAKE